jgi:ABC-2 type transport system permease protein
MTMLPFSSPILMPMRYLLGGASFGQLMLSIAILAASTAGVAIVAARIYRVGILMYGKRPSLRELVRWLRY